MSRLLDVQRTLERRLDTSDTIGPLHYEEQEQQDRAADNVFPGGLSREPDSRRGQTHTGLMERLGLDSNVYRGEGLTGVGDGDLSGDFGSAEDQTHPEDALCE